MDRISEALLKEFSAEHDLSSLPESKRFEHFAGYIAVRPHYSETFDTDDIVTGNGGMDNIAIIVNGSLITDIDALAEKADNTSYLDVSFVFVEAHRSSSFDAAGIGNFGYAVTDFFRPAPSQTRNEKVRSAAEVMNGIYARSSKFKRGNPSCWLYYVTTGRWTEDPNLRSRVNSVVSDLEATQLFSRVTFVPVDAARLQALYRQTKNAISREFTFADKIVLPEVPGVTQAYLGILPVPEFLKLLRDDNDEIVAGLFYDNVRDWQAYNQVNDEIRGTILSDARRRFVLMNNGITIIARNLQPTGNKFLIEDYSIVNGCQTSHVLFDQRGTAGIDDSVMVPIRLIGTQDEDIINAIIRSTNRQTEVKEEQFFALQEFSKKLELFFQTFPDAHKLYYERRSRQYDRVEIEKTRIVLPANMIRAFAAMFLEEPHRATRNYSALAERVGSAIFGRDHRPEPYYAAAFTLYRLEYLFRSGRLEPKYKAARFHILMAVRILSNPDPVPPLNSREMERYCGGVVEKLWHASESDDLFSRAAQVIDAVAAGEFHRDKIRTEPFTASVIAACRAAR